MEKILFRMKQKMMKKVFFILMRTPPSLHIKSNRIMQISLMISRFRNTKFRPSLLMSLFLFKIQRKYSAVLSNCQSPQEFMFLGLTQKLFKTINCKLQNQKIYSLFFITYISMTNKTQINKKISKNSCRLLKKNYINNIK